MSNKIVYCIEDNTVDNPSAPDYDASQLNGCVIPKKMKEEYDSNRSLELGSNESRLIEPDAKKATRELYPDFEVTKNEGTEKQEDSILSNDKCLMTLLEMLKISIGNTKNDTNNRVCDHVFTSQNICAENMCLKLKDKLQKQIQCESEKMKEESAKERNEHQIKIDQLQTEFTRNKMDLWKEIKQLQEEYANERRESHDKIEQLQEDIQKNTIPFHLRLMIVLSLLLSLLLIFLQFNDGLWNQEDNKEIFNQTNQASTESNSHKKNTFDLRFWFYISCLVVFYVIICEYILPFLNISRNYDKYFANITFIIITACLGGGKINYFREK